MKTIKTQGFTLIELVVVIVILGILAVTAAPKFLNYQGDAHNNRAQAAFASFISASQMYHSMWLVEGEPTTAVTGYANGVIVPSVGGFPRTIASTSTIPNCPELWRNLLDTDLTIEVHSDPILPTDADIVSWYRGSGDSASCYFYYVSDINDYDTDIWTMNYFPQDGSYEVVRNNSLPRPQPTP
ncbi:type II secretion system protein [Vibrio sp. RE86]|uniref:type II secretion system protein n=1 Tax=Vibrio sp. RE86 TaxID=2607605 RepID=UPI0014938FC4|nr:type II secretion system protein [Vibrio sp. RE86]NOH79251.1 type II secretion system protein [Vibrio sp. RE86]